MDTSNNYSSSLSVLNIFSMLSSVNSSLLEFLALIEGQVQFSTLLVLRSNLSRVDNSMSDDFEKFTSHPFIQLTNSKQFQLHHHFKDDILAIVYLSASSYRDMLDALAKDLHRIAQTKIIFVCLEMQDMMRELFQLCWRKKMINAIALLQDTYYTYSPFPEMHLTQHSVHDDRKVIPHHLPNLHRNPLRIVLDHLEPRDYVYTNRKGEELIGGYAGHLIASFAEKINATLTTPIDNKNEVFHHTDYDELITSDVIDIFAGLAYQIPSTRGQSDVAEVIGWCLMVPVEPNLPQYLYYPMILTSLPILLMFGMVIVFSFTINCILSIERKVAVSVWRMFLKEDCVRALLGQSFTEYQQPSVKLRMIYFLSCIWGLFFSTWYQATLHMLVTSPPTEHRVSSFEDIQQSPLKILMFRGEYDDIRKTTDEFEKYIDTFEFTHNNTWYHATRDSLNRRYAFPVPSNKWKIFEEQQSLYKAPIFRNTDLCIARLSLMVFLLNENSIFTKPLNQMIVRTHQSGLYGYWVRKAFLELVEGGRIELDSQSEGEGPKPFRLDDMKWLWGLFGVLIAIDCAVFVMEIICGFVIGSM